MAEIIANHLYKEELKQVAMSFPYKRLESKRVFVTGATGMIGSFLIDELYFLMKTLKISLSIVAMARNEEKARERFSSYIDDSNFSLYIGDVRCPIEYDGDIDIVFHCASNADPVAYANDPVGTMTTNFIGTRNILEFCKDKGSCLIYLSTFNVYGKNRGDVDKFTEDYTGNLKIESRSCYPESKRSSETLCCCYGTQYNVDYKIARLCRVFGPTMTSNDSKAQAQFFRAACSNNDIVLKSDGKQYYSYVYTPDAVSAILYIALCGENGGIYNIGNDKCNIHLGDFAHEIARQAETNIVFDVQSEKEKAGSMNSVYDIVDYSRLSSLGWMPIYDIKKAVNETLCIMKEVHL